MFDLAKLLLRLNYFYGRLLGVINFKFDLKTGRASLSTTATIYAVFVNILILALVPLLIHTRIWQVFWTHTNGLHEQVFLFLIVMRVSCVYVTLWSRWWQRKRILKLLASYRRMVLQQPQVMRLWRRGVISKFISGTLTECIHMILAMTGLRGKLNILTVSTMLMLYVLIGLLNVILSQFYFSLLTMHGHYILFNHELRSIIAEINQLQQDYRRDISYLLAKRLNTVARLQSELQGLSERMIQIFGLQALSMSTILNISLISGIYLTFSAAKYGLSSIDWAKWNNLLLIVGVICYLTDSSITYSITYFIQDRHAEMVELVAEYPTFAWSLDKCLENAFECFQLQLVRNPPKVTIMGLFTVSRTNLAPLLSSLISYSFILIQYDIKNYKYN